LKKIILIEPRLKGLGSHYLSYAINIGEVASKQGIPTIIFVDRDIEKNVQAALQISFAQIVPVFPSNQISRLKIRAVIWPVMTVIYAWILMRYVQKISGDNIVCTVSGNLEYLAGAAIALLTRKCKFNLIIQMYSWETREHTSATPRTIRIYRLLTEKLVRKAIDSGLLSLAGQGQEVTQHISKQLGRAISSLPFAINWSNFSEKKSNSGRLSIGFLGVMRAEKGFQQFAAAVECLKADVEIIIQAQLPEALSEPNASILIDRLKHDRRCRVFEGELVVSEYKAILSNIDIVILPYRPADFANKTSNIFAECLGLGKLMIAPRATLMGQIMLSMDIGVVYSPYSADALAQAINTTVSNFEELQSNMEGKASRWREGNSAESFLQRVIQLAGG
jgi:glycosyltransferase involved in cell wall biosynthesis